jgi:hypothetical protein
MKWVDVAKVVSYYSSESSLWCLSVEKLQVGELLKLFRCANARTTFRGPGTAGRGSLSHRWIDRSLGDAD